MARDLTSYLDDWSISDSGERKSASGGDNQGEPANGDGGGVPGRWDSPTTPEWGLDGDDGRNTGGYGHADDCKDVGMKDTAWGMSKSDIAAGYSKPGSGGAGEPGTSSFPQSIPDTNPHDRGAGSDAYARAYGETTGRGFDGRGQPKSTSNPGGESLGSSKLPS